MRPLREQPRVAVVLAVLALVLVGLGVLVGAAVTQGEGAEEAAARRLEAQLREREADLANVQEWAAAMQERIRELEPELAAWRRRAQQAQRRERAGRGWRRRAQRAERALSQARARERRRRRRR